MTQMGEGAISLPRMSVILITPDCYATLRRTVGALRRQTARAALELVIVGPPAHQLNVNESDLEGFAGWRLVEYAPMRSTSAARAAGIGAATAPIIVLAEDHSFPQPDWAEALIARYEEGWAGVGPAVGNANPQTTVSWANLIIEYGDWLTPLPSEPAAHIPGHNSSYKRDALLAYGDQLPDLMEAESAMQWKMMADGHRFCMEPRAVTLHTNFTRTGPSIRQRFAGGRLFAANRAREWPLWKRAAYAIGSPLIPLVRLRRCLRTARRIGQRRIGRLAAALALLLAADGLGEMVGYAAGAGQAMRSLSDIEFHRERFVRTDDWQSIDAQLNYHLSVVTNSGREAT